MIRTATGYRRRKVIADWRGNYRSMVGQQVYSRDALASGLPAYLRSDIGELIWKAADERGDGLSVTRILNCLYNEKIYTVEDLLRRSPYYFRKTPNFGIKSFRLMTELLASKGIAYPPQYNVPEPTYAMLDRGAKVLEASGQCIYDRVDRELIRDIWRAITGEVY